MRGGGVEMEKGGGALDPRIPGIQGGSAPALEWKTGGEPPARTPGLHPRTGAAKRKRQHHEMEKAGSTQSGRGFAWARNGKVEWKGDMET